MWFSETPTLGYLTSCSDTKFCYIQIAPPDVTGVVILEEDLNKPLAFVFTYHWLKIIEN